MKIKEFVKEVLIEIAHGVNDASEDLKDMDVLINPRTHQSHDIIYKSSDDFHKARRIQNIEFDISVSIDDKSEDRKGVSVVAGVFGIGAANKDSLQNISYHKVKFTVPISLPVFEK
ncbi:hypothetical protein ACLOAU_14370 [Niabella sp. CJ426]|uniref:hypothetical protein n=1 Tax=Niabella sp. CJ426 TaxID=3393740 RepID=UPI003D048568